MGQMLADGSELCSQGDGSSVGAAGSQGNDVVPKSVLVVDTVLSSYAFWFNRRGQVQVTLVQTLYVV